MRLIHTADLHLGKILHEQSLLDDQAPVLDQIAGVLEAGGYDLFLVAGDVFDRSVPPPEALALWDRFLGRVSRIPGLKVVVVPGNHDGALRLSFAASFLETASIFVRTRLDDLDKPLTLTLGGQEWDIFAVPFLQAGSLETAGPEGPVQLRSQRDLWKTALERIAAARRPGVRSLLVTHLFTLGGAESDSERLFVGEAEQIPAPWLAGWDYVALGHLHRVQNPAPGVWYSGSPLAYSFSEAGQEKVVLEWDEGRVTPRSLAAPRPLTRLSGSFESFLREGAGAEARDHWVEVTLTDPALVPGALERLREVFPGLLSLVQGTAGRSPTGTEASPAARRRTGDVAADSARFLAEVGLDPDPGTRELLAALAQEVLHAAP